MITLYAKREPSAPFRWVVRDEVGNQIDRDQYSNDLRERYSKPEYDLIFPEDGWIEFWDAQS